jgi:DNA repair protein RecN (Recombination protein N)
LRYQISELETLNPEPDEWHSLDQRQTQLAHTRELAEGAWTSLQQLTEDESGSALLTLNQASARLHNLAQYDPRLETMATEFDELQVRLTETGNDLRHYLEGYELDPEEYARVQARLGALHEAARKYQVRPEALKDALEKLQQELATTTDSNQQLTVLEQSLSDLNQRYDELAADVSQARQVAAKQLGKAVTAHLAEFGLTDADFRVKLLPIDEEDRQRYGRERVQFTVRTTHEMAYGPLERVASGGELSRISLALQVVTSAVDPVPISIYDEVDVGIGGRVAEIVGSKLRTLGQDRQVLCITHLPQVAVQGEGHLRVTKASGTRSDVAVELLDPDERIEEIARMLGGVKITRQTRDHARDMLSRVSS